MAKTKEYNTNRRLAYRQKCELQEQQSHEEEDKNEEKRLVKNQKRLVKNQKERDRKHKIWQQQHQRQGIKMEESEATVGLSGVTATNDDEAPPKPVDTPVAKQWKQGSPVPQSKPLSTFTGGRMTSTKKAALLTRNDQYKDDLIGAFKVSVQGNKDSAAQSIDMVTTKNNQSAAHGIDAARQIASDNASKNLAAATAFSKQESSDNCIALQTVLRSMETLQANNRALILAPSFDGSEDGEFGTEALPSPPANRCRARARIEELIEPDQLFPAADETTKTRPFTLCFSHLLAATQELRAKDGWISVSCTLATNPSVNGPRYQCKIRKIGFRDTDIVFLESGAPITPLVCQNFPVDVEVDETIAGLDLKPQQLEINFGKCEWDSDYQARFRDVLLECIVHSEYRLPSAFKVALSDLGILLREGISCGPITGPTLRNSVAFVDGDNGDNLLFMDYKSMPMLDDGFENFNDQSDPSITLVTMALLLGYDYSYRMEVSFVNGGCVGFQLACKELLLNLEHFSAVVTAIGSLDDVLEIHLAGSYAEGPSPLEMTKDALTKIVANDKIVFKLEKFSLTKCKQVALAGSKCVVIFDRCELQDGGAGLLGKGKDLRLIFIGRTLCFKDLAYRMKEGSFSSLHLKEVSIKHHDRAGFAWLVQNSGRSVTWVGDDDDDDGAADDDAVLVLEDITYKEENMTHESFLVLKKELEQEAATEDVDRKKLEIEKAKKDAARPPPKNPWNVGDFKSFASPMNWRTDAWECECGVYNDDASEQCIACEQKPKAAGEKVKDTKADDALTAAGPSKTSAITLGSVDKSSIGSNGFVFGGGNKSSIGSNGFVFGGGSSAPQAKEKAATAASKQSKQVATPGEENQGANMSNGARHVRFATTELSTGDKVPTTPTKTPRRQAKAASPTAAAIKTPRSSARLRKNKGK